ncbi:MAG: hypothetical protein GY938_16595 [Ketobacter sp.]|nr:hypothetical protein [Ketobacter sp.]
MDIIQTSNGLPNSDAFTGKPIVSKTAFARNEDEAITGLIFATKANLNKYFGVKPVSKKK